MEIERRTYWTMRVTPDDGHEFNRMKFSNLHHAEDYLRSLTSVMGRTCRVVEVEEVIREVALETGKVRPLKGDEGHG